MKTRFVLRIAAFITTLVLLTSSLSIFPNSTPAHAADPVDLQVSLPTVTSFGNPGDPYSATLLVSNNSPVAVDGATFYFEYPWELTGITITCGQVSAGVTCDPASFTRVGSPTRSGYTRVRGTLTSFPANATASIVFNGTLPMNTSYSSFASYGHVDPPAGVTDVNLASNDTQQTTGVNKVQSAVTVTKTADKTFVNNGDTVTYTVSYRNSGNFAVNLTIQDLLSLQPNPGTIGGYKYSRIGGGGSASYSFRISQCALSGSTCPAWLTTNQTYNASGKQITIFNSSTYGTHNHYSGNSSGLRLGAGQSLVLTIPVTFNLTGCVTEGGQYINFHNGAIYHSALGANPQPNPTSDSEYVDTYVALRTCGVVNLKVTKVADRVVMNPGETVSYTVTYDNSSGAFDALVDIEDYLTLNPNPYYFSYNGQNLRFGTLKPGGSWAFSFRIAECTMTGGACPAWLSTGATYEQANLSGAGSNTIFASYGATNSTRFYGGGVSKFVVPAGQKITLKIPVTIRVNGCATEGGDYLNFSNSASYRADYDADPSVNPRYGFEGHELYVRVGACPNTSLQVTKSPDNTVINNGGSVNYTVTYRNTGQNPATVDIRDYFRVDSNSGTTNVGGRAINYGAMNSSGSFAHQYRITSCTLSGGTCPAWLTAAREVTASNISFGAYLFRSDTSDTSTISGRNTKVVIPAGSTLTITMAYKIQISGCPTNSAEYLRFRNSAEYESDETGNVVLNPPRQDAYTYLYVKVASCFDVSTQTFLRTRSNQSLTQPTPRQPVTVVSRVINTQGTATNIPVTQVLPARGILKPSEAKSLGLVADESSAITLVCRQGTGNTAGTIVACPAGLRYDPATHTVTGTLPGPIATGSWFEIGTQGYVGIIPPATATYPLATKLGAMSSDLNPINDSQIGFGLTNSRTSVFTSHSLNIPAPQNIVLTGQLVCQVQGNQTATPPGLVRTFRVTLARGATQVDQNLVVNNLWKGDNCTITITRPAAPAGYYWSDAREWQSTVSVQSINNIQDVWRTRYPMKLGKQPTVTLPFTGGLSEQLFQFGGLGLLALMVTALAYYRQRRA